MNNYRRGNTDVVPKRPMVTFLSSVLNVDIAKPLGKLLVLDEAHAIENTESMTYKTVKAARENHEGCLKLTGTPLDNTWEDAFALFSLLRDHPVRTLEQFQSSFSDWEKTPQDQRFALVPTGFFQERLIQMSDAFMLRRPESLMTEGLPPLSRYNIEFELNQEDLEQSNDHFRQYKKAARTLAAIPLARTGGRRFNKWSSLILAQQYACHAGIVELMDQIRARMLSDPDDPDNDVDLADLEATALHHNENRKIHMNWLGAMRLDDNWRSPRVDVILDIFDRHKTLFESAKVVVVDESIFCSRVSNACLGLTLPLLS